MIITAEVRYCWPCQVTGTHDVEYEVKRGKPVEVKDTCRNCNHISHPQPVPAHEQQNGGAGQIQYRERRMR